jgi:hypothetical protein
MSAPQTTGTTNSEVANVTPKPSTSSFPAGISQMMLPSNASQQAPLPANASQVPLPANASQAPLPAKASQAPLPASGSQAPLPASDSQAPLPANSQAPGPVVSMPTSDDIASEHLPLDGETKEWPSWLQTHLLQLEASFVSKEMKSLVYNLPILDALLGRPTNLVSGHD